MKICKIQENNNYQNMCVIFVGTDMRKLRNLAFTAYGKVILHSYQNIFHSHTNDCNYILNNFESVSGLFFNNIIYQRYPLIRLIYAQVKSNKFFSNLYRYTVVFNFIQS